MTDQNKLNMLVQRLRRIEHGTVASWERSIVDVARLALETEIQELAKRLHRDAYWRRSARPGYATGA